MRKLIKNARIYTADPAIPEASAMIMEDGKITWIGSDAELADQIDGSDATVGPDRTAGSDATVGPDRTAGSDATVGPDRTAGSDATVGPDRTAGSDATVDTVIDAAGARILPGFVDDHMHPLMLADFSRQISCLPPNVNSIRELTAKIAQAAETAGPEDWILGWGYDEGKFVEQRSPNRYDLDAGAPDHPVSLIRSCQHIRCVNSKALELAGITRDTPDPDGGEIERDATGEPTGVLKENARNLVLPFMPKTTDDDRVSAIIELGKLLASQGVTSITDMGNLHPGENMPLFRAAIAGGFRQKISAYYMWDYFLYDPSFTITEADMGRDQQLRVAGLKLIGDGSISGHTAWLQKPYLNGEFGMPVYSDESMEAAIDFCKRSGCQLSVHAMGGQAINRVLDRVSREEDWTDGGVPYVRVEHITEPTDHSIELAAEHGVAFTLQPIFMYSEIETYLENMGAERLPELYPVASLLDRGVKVSISTDAPATSWATPSDPMPNLKAAVTRTAYDGTDTGSSQRIDIRTAIDLYTREAAQTCGLTHTGMLKPGYRADFILLDRDILAIPGDQIDQVQISQTWIDSELVYDRNSK